MTANPRHKVSIDKERAWMGEMNLARVVGYYLEGSCDLRELS